jgi:hypothetical protein
VIVVVNGFELPGLRCRPGPGENWHENVHVGVCVRGQNRDGLAVVPSRPWAIWEPVPGDAEGARWEMEIAVRRLEGAFDFGGPFVRGHRGDRHIGLAWGDVPGDGTLRLFRAAKLRLETIEPATIEAASAPGARLVARLGLTDGNGNPRCATVRPPDVAWSAEAGLALAREGAGSPAQAAHG